MWYGTFTTFTFLFPQKLAVGSESVYDLVALWFRFTGRLRGTLGAAPRPDCNDSEWMVVGLQAFHVFLFVLVDHRISDDCHTESRHSACERHFRGVRPASYNLIRGKNVSTASGYRTTRVGFDSDLRLCLCYRGVLLFLCCKNRDDEDTTLLGSVEARALLL